MPDAPAVDEWQRPCSAVRRGVNQHLQLRDRRVAGFDDPAAASGSAARHALPFPATPTEHGSGRPSCAVSVSHALVRSTRRAGSPRTPTSLARGDRPARACRLEGTDALRVATGNHHEPRSHARPVARHTFSRCPASRILQPGASSLQSKAMSKTRSYQEERGVRQVVPLLPRKASTKLSAPQESADCTRRMQKMRLSPEAAGRFPLCTVPRRS